MYNRPVRVSLILTVLNEAGSLRPLLVSLAAQTRSPDEIVVADGGSTDGTLDILQDAERAGHLPIRVVAAPNTNISQGRNAAIRITTGEVIAVTDAGVRADERWLEELIKPFEGAKGSGQEAGRLGQEAMGGMRSPHAVAGFFAADGKTPFEIAMGATVLPEARDVNPETYCPSNRSVAFRRSVWEAAGGYPEWLDYGEDVLFDLKVRRLFGPFVFAPEATVHFRPRDSLRTFARQYYRYARGDGKAGLFPQIHAIRYLSYIVVAPLIAYAGINASPWLWLLYLVGGLAYVRTPYRRLWPRLRNLSPVGRLVALVSVPLIRVTGDLAKMAGYPAGVVWRVKRALTDRQ